jgi:primosomal protein N' (replication factor Y)
VYLRAIQAVLDRGGSAIVLVPEISLTPQTAGRFIARFGAERVAVLHSALTASQRNLQWTRVAGGEARVVIGARSAVFAPVDPSRAPLGLVVIDEEHDSSYKQDSLPRYHARNVALKRAQLASCPVVMGSATPSLESWHAATAARVGLLTLHERVGGGRLPAVEIVDLAQERRARDDSSQRIHSLGPRLEHALRGALDAGGQAILLLNRRGYASYIHCPASGWVLTCDRCDATMVFHKAPRIVGGGVVRCHHCLAEQRLPGACPESGERLSLFGAGSQRLEEELARKFPDLALGASLLRLDSDSMRKASDYFEALDAFRRGEARVLVGTQMIAKGLDYPNVRLIGVVNADTAINLPDFRAAERTFQLVAQVAGRAGRSAASASARVIVQTWNPREPALRYAARHDYPGFATHELALRESARLPPITRMARIVVRDPDHHRATNAALALHRSLVELREPRLRLRPPAPCAITRIAGQHRVAIDLLAPGVGPIQRALTHLRNEGRLKADTHTAVDVDPTALL